jgi:hypothetical protein
MAVQLIGTNGAWPRAPVKWIVRATTSLPVPLSPVMSTFERLLEIFRIRAKISCMAGLAPIRSPNAVVLSSAAAGGGSPAPAPELERALERGDHRRRLKGLVM